MIYLDLGEWQIVLICRSVPVLGRIASLFQHRASGLPWPGRKLLTCEVIQDAGAFSRLAGELAFCGPQVQISPAVKASYALSAGYTWFSIPHTAIACLRDSHPDQATVWLDPASYATDVTAQPPPVRPEPEAFLYPLCVEWLRNVGACLVHCGAVELSGRALMFTGPPGSGKSTHVLRLVKRGAHFLADDLAILHRHAGEIVMRPFREVANVSVDSMQIFPELADLKGCPLRGDKKLFVSIVDRLHCRASDRALPGVIAHIVADDAASLEWFAGPATWGKLHQMAWFVSRPEASARHFDLLLDWVTSCRHVRVTRGYLQQHASGFMSEIQKATETFEGISPHESASAI